MNPRSLDRLRSLFASVLMACCAGANAEVALPSVYSDHMVLQRDAPLTVWGWATPGERVEVHVGGQTAAATTGDAGRWAVTFDPMPATESTELHVAGPTNELTLEGVAVGDVWLCSGQSNMAMSVEQSWNADLEIPKADRPAIRLLTIGNHGAQHPVYAFRGAWAPCTPETVREFSAVGYYFGRELHERLRVPIGLIDNAWGGSTCEAWVPTSRLEADPRYEPLLGRWRDRIAERAEAFQEHERAFSAEFLAGKAPPPKPPWDDAIAERHRPGNLFFARLAPLSRTRLRGVIWYQGEANTRRAHQYRELFPLMIASWREALGQDDLPFYWSQLPDYHREGGPPRDSAWAELREAQTLTLDRLPHTGQAVTIDLGEAGTIHPREKEAVARRLARVALADAYGLPVASRSPRFDGFTRDGDALVVDFSDAEGGLETVDSKTLQGFTLAGEDRRFHPADAELLADHRVRVTSERVPEPVAVRYAWANNPVCNLYTTAGLPVTPFRSDDWPGITDDER